MSNTESITNTYKLVHQGGHHNVYCDGDRHLWTDGGFCHADIEIPYVRREGKCDCHRFK